MTFLRQLANKLMSRCRACGSSADVISYDPRGLWAYFWRRTYCPDHCPDHDYVYDRYDGHCCDNCGQPATVEWHLDRAEAMAEAEAEAAR